MGGNYRALGDFQDIPEALIADMAHIHQIPQALSLLNKLPAHIGQPAAGDMGAGERVLLVPAQTHHPEAGFVEFLQPGSIVFDAGGTFQCQNGGHNALFPVGFHIRSRAGLANQIGINVQFLLNDGKFPFKGCDRRDAIPLLHKGGCEAGKALGIATVDLRPLQIDMSAVPAQRAAAIHVMTKQCQSGITVKIKNGNIHWNASSIWWISGRTVAVPSGA